MVQQEEDWRALGERCKVVVSRRKGRGEMGWPGKGGKGKGEGGLVWIEGHLVSECTSSAELNGRVPRSTKFWSMLKDGPFRRPSTSVERERELGEVEGKASSVGMPSCHQTG